MKKILLALVVATMTLTGCGSRTCGQPLEGGVECGTCGAGSCLLPAPTGYTAEEQAVHNKAVDDSLAKSIPETNQIQDSGQRIDARNAAFKDALGEGAAAVEKMRGEAGK